MGTEIERKFLVKSDAWRAGAATQSVLRQGYLASDGGNTVRVRLDDRRAWLTVKGPSEGCRRAEFEYELPLEEAEELLELCGNRVVEKMRSRVPVGLHVWEVDEFAGRNAGLTVAEIELSSESEAVHMPDWVGREVTGDRRFDNASLSRCPLADWSAADRAMAVI
jgi:adenylate cyclase